MSNILVRIEELRDAKWIAKVHVETWQHAYLGQIPDADLQSLSTEKRTEYWKEILASPKENAHTMVAEVDKKIAGFCSVSHCRDEDMSAEIGELWAIYVDKDSMEKGVGTELLQKGLEYLRMNGYKKATLWVLTTNQKTRRWYESKGWYVEGKTKTDQIEGFAVEETRYTI